MQIVFKNIEIHNFLSLGDVSVDLNECGFIIVNGRNEEGSVIQSNGSGKSSIFDAIFWTITGETLRGSDSIVNEKSNDGCYCTVTFESDGTEYKILRSKGNKQYGNAVYFYEDNNLLSDQTKKSQELILKTIPATSSDILGSIILLGQGLPYRFSALSPSKRKDLLEVMSGSSTQIDKVKYQIDQEEAQYQAQLSSKTQEIQRISGMISGLKTSIEMLVKQQEDLSDIDKLRSEIKDKESQILENTKLIEDSNECLTRVRSLLQSYQESRNQVAQVLSDKNNEAMQIKIRIGQVQSGNCPTCGRPYEVTSEILEQKSKDEQELSELNTMLDTLRTKTQNIDNLINTSRIEENNYCTTISQLTFKIDSLQKDINSINNLLTQVESITEQIEKISSEIKYGQIQINDINKETEVLQEYLDCVGYIKRQLSRDFKGYMLDEVIKFLSTRSQYYSEFLFSNDKKIEVTLSGNKIMITSGGRPYENLSGGERQRADLAVQFALRDMLVVTSGFSCNLLVLDEAFDNLDAQGSESLIRLVTTEFSDIDSVFIVTHHSDISIPYDKIITVIKGKDGISNLEVI